MEYEIDKGTPDKKEMRRSGKKADGSTWAINLEIHPDWLAQWQNQQLLQEVRSMGFAPSTQLISSAYGMPVHEILEAKIVPPSLPPAKPRTITREQGKELLNLVRDLGWSPEAFKALLNSINCDRLGELTIDDYKKIQEIIASY